MQVTILYRGKQKRFRASVSMRRLVSAVTLCSVALLISSRGTSTTEENVTRVQVITDGIMQQQAELEQFEQATQQRLDGIIKQLAALKTELMVLDSISVKLAKKNGFESADFALPEVLDTDSVTDAELSAQVAQFSEQLALKSQQLTALQSLIEGVEMVDKTTLSGRPIKNGWLSSYYGIRNDPFNGRPAMHKGLDFAGKEGEPVVATAAGIVTWSGRRSGYGLLVELDHGNGYKTRYAHNKELLVKVGEVITKGQSLALMGNTGRSTGAHVHYEVIKNGKQVDPLAYIY